ncbi:MAG: glycosyltransferase [Nanoarchaeota archaeon]|nr:glycosyltransferase [Nanoarchaeota archaeon]
MNSSVSVIIPCYNAESAILRTLEALDNQTAKGFEVILADDGSQDRTVSIAKSFKPRNFKLIVIPGKHAGPAAQRNRGAEKAKGGILLFTDSDCVPDGNWVEEMAKPFSDKNIVGVSGAYKTLNKNKLIARFEGYEIARRHERMAKQKYINFIGSFSAGYRKAVFKKFGGFSSEFKRADAEDPELSFKIAKAGCKMVFNPNAIVAHPHVASLKKFWNQKFSRGYWRVLLYKKHPEKMMGDSYTGKEVQLSLIFLAGFLLSFAGFFVFAFLKNAAMADTLAKSAILAHALFYLANFPAIVFMIQKEKKMALFAPAIIFVRTLAWGLGFGWGLVKLVLKRSG